MFSNSEFMPVFGPCASLSFTDWFATRVRGAMVDSCVFCCRSIAPPNGVADIVIPGGGAGKGIAPPPRGGAPIAPIWKPGSHLGSLAGRQGVAVPLHLNHLFCQRLFLLREFFCVTLSLPFVPGLSQVFILGTNGASGGSTGTPDAGTTVPASAAGV